MCTDRGLAKRCVLEVHVTRPYSIVSISLPFSVRTFRLGGAVVLSYNSGPNLLKHAHMRPIRSVRRHPYVCEPAYRRGTGG